VGKLVERVGTELGGDDGLEEGCELLTGLPAGVVGVAVGL
jgi:hypothetical protein